MSRGDNQTKSLVNDESRANVPDLFAFGVPKTDQNNTVQQLCIFVGEWLALHHIRDRITRDSDVKVELFTVATILLPELDSSVLT